MHPPRRPSTGRPLPAATLRPRWQRMLWLAFGALSLATGIVGAFLPVLPTTPFVLLAAFGFSRGCDRCERGSAWAWWTLPSPYRWLPGIVCLVVGTWLVRLPTAPPRT